MATKSNAVGGVLLLLVIIFVGYLLMHSDTKPEVKLTGVWQMGEHEVQFDQNNKYRDVANGFLIDYGEYSVDYSQKPAWVTIVSEKSYPSGSVANNYFFVGVPKQSIAKGIIRFITSTEMEMAFTAIPTTDFGASGVYEFRLLNDKRPASFNTTSQITLNTFVRTSTLVGWGPVTFRSASETIILPFTRINK